MNLDDGRRIMFGRVLSGSAMVMAVGGMIVAIAVGRWEIAWLTLSPVNATVGLGFGALAWTVLPSHPRNGSVWAYTWAAFFGGLYSACLGVLVISTPGDVLDQNNQTSLIPAELPWPAAVAVGVMISIWLLAVFLPLTLGLLLFPDGRLPSPRWRWVGYYSAATLTAAVIASLVLNNRWSTRAIGSVEGTFGLFVELLAVLAQLGALFAVGSVLVRYRSSDSVVRRQIRWIGLGGALFFIGLALAVWQGYASSAPGSVNIENLLTLVPLVVLIASFGVAIAKHDLFDIDVVVSRSVMYAGLGVVITGVYALIVAGPLLVIGESDDGGPGLVLPVVATGVVAVLFEPVRSRMQRWANRLVFGQRSSPHEVLSQVTARLAESGSGGGTDDLARLLVEGTGAESAVVWLVEGENMVADGVWPVGESVVEPVATSGLVGDELVVVADVRFGEGLLGAVSVTKSRSDPVSPADRVLVSDVAAGAALVLRNIGLNRELEERARQVRESRRRLIAAQDAERHRLERDLHDGAQQQVVALKVKLGIAQTLAGRAGVDEVGGLISGLAAETQQAVDALRAVAHGIYPPLLEAEGLEVALRAVERTSPVSLRVSVDGLGRYDRPVEETIYFCVLEAVERAHMAGASGVDVGLTRRNGDLITEIDLGWVDAELDLRAVADRVDAADGTLTVEDEPERGRRIIMSLPVAQLEDLDHHVATLR